jgi:hypothetical protein
MAESTTPFPYLEAVVGMAHLYLFSCVLFSPKALFFRFIVSLLLLSNPVGMCAFEDWKRLRRLVCRPENFRQDDYLLLYFVRLSKGQRGLIIV